MNFIDKLFSRLDLSERMIYMLSYTSKIIFVVIIALLAYLIAIKIVIKLLGIVIKKSKNNWDNIFFEKRVFHKLARLIPLIIISAFASSFPEIELIIQKIVVSLIYLSMAFVLSALLDAINDIYNRYPVSKVRPIKAVLQIVKIVIYIIVFILIVALVINKNPLLMIGSIGALTAILSLIFKDSILGFVAGMQLVGNDMLRIGDWIEMPQYGADGDVIEISLNTVKIRNWDKTITTIPAYALVSDSFKNWRGMVETGGRRLKRPIFIDTSTIKFCDEGMLKRFRKIHLLEAYIDQKEKEITSYNIENEIDTSLLVNGRHLTNIGTFRKYIENYLENHPKVHKGLTRMVRQLEPGERGLPLEVYAFINDTTWANYENAQADIFDHIFAVADIFELKIFQNPTGNDFKFLETYKGQRI